MTVCSANTRGGASTTGAGNHGQSAASDRIRLLLRPMKRSETTRTDSLSVSDDELDDQKPRLVESAGQAKTLRHSNQGTTTISTTSSFDRTDTTDDSIDQSSHVRRVSFGEVEIYTFAPTLGDHPCCDGPPLALSYDEPVAHQTLPVVQHDETRPDEPTSLMELHIDSEVRQDMLLQNQISQEDMSQTVRQCTTIQEQRQQTLATLLMTNTDPPRTQRRGVLQGLAQVQKMQQVTSDNTF